MATYRCPNCMTPGQPGACPQCGFDPMATPQQEYALPYGFLLKERYHIGKVLGQGGFGITYVGWDELLAQKVAIKEFYPSGQVMRSASSMGTSLLWNSTSQSEELRKNGMEAFIREAQKMARVREIREVVHVTDIFYANDTAYIVMDFVEGQTLKQVLAQRGPLSWQEASPIFLQAISAMEQVHSKGMIHRDLSPDNLMLQGDGSVRILDLGAAKDLSANSGASSMLVAKGGFSPLEQYTQRGSSGPHSDVYAMAATLYYTLSGVMPPPAMDRVEQDRIRWDLPQLQALPPQVLNALRQAMTLLTKDRTQTMGQFYQQLTAPGFGYPMYQTSGGSQPMYQTPNSSQQPTYQTPNSAQQPAYQTPQPGYQPPQQSYQAPPGYQATQPLGYQVPQQPVYQPPGYQNPYQAQPKKTKVGLIVGIASAALVLVIGLILSITLAVKNNRKVELPTPEPSQWNHVQAPTEAPIAAPTTTEPPSTQVAPLVNSWFALLQDSEDEARRLLELIEAYDVEIELMDLTALEYGQYLHLREDLTYDFVYAEYVTWSCTRDYYELFVDTMYDNRTKLDAIYGESFGAMSKEEFQQFYAQLYNFTDYEKFLDTLADNAYDYESLATPWESGTYYLQDDRIYMTIDGDTEALYVTYELSGSQLTIYYTDTIEHYVATE